MLYGVLLCPLFLFSAILMQDAMTMQNIVTLHDAIHRVSQLSKQLRHVENESFATKAFTTFEYVLRSRLSSSPLPSALQLGPTEENERATVSKCFIKETFEISEMYSRKPCCLAQLQ